ncbi:MAG: DNA-protecting protein DprA [Xanthomonadales bacterium PRO7]|jgi:DNA processing protein|nr:DNA-protecting protein DprA [Xanthomonadales bacterium PRO7]HMM56018.1 DNA-processing protein DprA [Rudaea sp.]
MPLELSLDETRAWLALLRVPGLGAGGVRELVGRHGGASAAQAAAARDARVGAEARAWLGAPDAAAIERDIAWLDAPDHHLIVATSEDFPSLLRDVSNPPAALFVAGDTACLWSAQIAIVGSRSASAGGMANARAFAKSFAQAGNTVTSGLAEGIDGAAHEGALEGGGKTIAVLGTGPDLVYPRKHADLAHRVLSAGALVSEFPPGTPGKPENFPRRNRLIAGLSLGTLVVEAGLNSGSLITARMANEAGREVFALPGSIHSPLARGCHKLIRDGAKLVETAEEVIAELRGVGGLLAEGLRRRLDSSVAPAPPMSGAAQRDPEYRRLLEALDAEPAALDELVERTGLPAAALSSMLLVLELDGAVAAENGRYARR